MSLGRASRPLCLRVFARSLLVPQVGKVEAKSNAQCGWMTCDSNSRSPRHALCPADISSAPRPVPRCGRAQSHLAAVDAVKWRRCAQCHAVSLAPTFLSVCLGRAKRYHLQALACLRLLACHTDCTFPRLLRGQLSFGPALRSAGLLHRERRLRPKTSRASFSCASSQVNEEREAASQVNESITGQRARM